MTAPSTSPVSIDALRLEQARRLQQTVVSSCVTVEIVILSLSPMFVVNGQPMLALGWIVGSSLMVAMVFAYSRLIFREEINASSCQRYLRGHIVISATTGMVWSGFSIYQLDEGSLLSMYIATIIPMSITLGGMFPSSAYRSTYIAILSTCVLPVGCYWFITMTPPSNFYAIGFLVYYVFGLIASARAELNMRDIVLGNNMQTLNAKLQEQNANIAKASSERSEFMLATVHDFSQPIHAQGYFIHALRDLLTTDRQLELLDKIEASWQSQGDLLQGIADITRIDSGLIGPKASTFDAHHLLTTVAEEFREDAQRGGITLNINVQSLRVHTDPSLLKRIVRNLLSNAIRNTPPHETVTLATDTEGTQHLIRVIDTGVGIAEDDQRRIFDEYVQLTTLRSDQLGLGLGLSIVRRLTELLDIDLSLESELGVGSAFTLSMDFAEDAVDSLSDVTESVVSSEARILLVDDEEAITSSMATLMSSWGCRVVTAHSFDEALQVMINLEAPPTLLIVDNRLSHQDSGLALIDALRDEVNDAVPAIIMTADLHGLETMEERTDVRLMIKPVNPGDLRQIVLGEKTL